MTQYQLALTYRDEPSSVQKVEISDLGRNSNPCHKCIPDLAEYIVDSRPLLRCTELFCADMEDMPVV